MGALVKLGDVAKVVSGYAFKSAAFKEGGPVPVLKIKNIKIGTASLEEAGYVCDTFNEKLTEKFHVREDDILISLTGSHMTQPNSVVGRVGRYPKGYPNALLNQRAGKVIPNLNKVDSDYLFYVLMQDDVRREIAQMASGAASQANVSPSQVESVEFLLPELNIQRRIGQTFKNYDNLIENNNRRIAILEDMAQSLYREWFVKFRFPNHEACQLKDSPLGQIPEGWKVKKLADIADINPASITKKTAPEEIHYIDIKSVNTGAITEIKTMPFEGAPSRARRKVQHGDIIWATVRPNRKQYSYMANPRENTIASTGFAVLRANNVSPEYLYHATTTEDFTAYLVNHATGAAYPAVNTKDFENADILVPDIEILKSFDKLVKATISESEILKSKNNNLKQQRDMLLPKLISGNISLSELANE